VTYVWVPGSWMVRPRPAAVYVEGHWLRRGSRWVWVAGYWR
jgi:WXXGXW repeat (2 copies)